MENEMIKDIPSYDPSKLSNRQLADDFRIVAAWYSLKRQGKDVKYSIETIVNLAKLIYDEIKKRVDSNLMNYGFHPERMKPYVKELYYMISKGDLLKNISDARKEDILDFDEIIHLNGLEWSDMHSVVIDEMERRGLKHGRQITETVENLSYILDQFEDAHIIHNFISLVGSTVKHDPGHEPNDIDIHVRSNLPKESYLRRAIEVRLMKMLKKEFASKIHFIFGDEAGSHDTFVPIYNLSLTRVKPEVINMMQNEGNFKPFNPFVPLKPSGVYGKTLFYSIDDLIKTVKLDEPIFVEEKFDGFRCVLHKKDGNVRLYSDQKKDITRAFPSIVESAKKLSDFDFIIDGELVAYDASGKSLGRRGLMEFIGSIESGKDVDDSNIKYHVFDIVYFNGNVVATLKQYERKKILETFEWKKNIVLVPYILCKNIDEVEKAVATVSSLPKSEGAVLKYYNSRYIGEKTDKWIKFRNTADIYVRVLEVLPVKGDEAWRYRCGFEVESENGFDSDYLEKFDSKIYHVFGNTFNTSIKADRGDVLNVIVQEIWRHESEKGVHYSWHKPKVKMKVDRKETSSLDDIDSIVVSRGILVKSFEMSEYQEDEPRIEVSEKFWSENWHNSYPSSGSDDFVYHYHFRGLNEDEINLDVDDLLKTNHSIHGDLRFRFKPGLLFGFTVFLGSTSENTYNRLSKGDKLQGAWKLYQPEEWLYVGKDKPYVSKPGGIGSTSNKFAKFFVIDSGKYEIGVWRKHFFEIFLHGNVLNGRYIITYAPVGNNRIWLISKPEDQRPYAETHDLHEVINELRRKGQKYLVWSKPGSKPVMIDVGDYEKH